MLIPCTPSLLLLLLLLSASYPAPQNLDPDVLKEIFGDAPRGGYGGAAAPPQIIAQEKTPSNLAVISGPVDYVAPEDPNSEPKATVETSTEFDTCSEYSIQGYKCVPYYQCSNGTIITDGAGLLDVRSGFGNLFPEESKCLGYIDVCCKDRDFVPPPAAKLVYKPKCGRRNDAGVGARILGFKEGESQFGEWPHMCAVLQIKEQPYGESRKVFKCGGSLIAPGVVLTAAHCVQEFRNSPEQVVLVRCGEWDTQKEYEPYPHQDRTGQHIQVHPEYNSGNLANDFALIFLDQEFHLDYHIDTVCLPSPTSVYDYSRCYATGWGKDRFGVEGAYQVVLKEIELELVEHAECQDKLRTTRLGNRFRLDESFTCAGGSLGKDTCKGDGGSPLVCPHLNSPDTYDHVGIVSWGIGCGEEGIPGVYAAVHSAVCWIDYAMTCYYGDRNGDFSSYWSFENAQCGVWLENRMVDVTKKIADGGKIGKVYEYVRGEYTQCKVIWQPGSKNTGPASAYGDDSYIPFERIGSNDTNIDSTVQKVEDVIGVVPNVDLTSTLVTVPHTNGSEIKNALADGVDSVDIQDNIHDASPHTFKEEETFETASNSLINSVIIEESTGNALNSINLEDRIECIEEMLLKIL